jgi:hypothetical protein
VVAVAVVVLAEAAVLAAMATAAAEGESKGDMVRTGSALAAAAVEDGEVAVVMDVEGEADSATIAGAQAEENVLPRIDTAAAMVVGAQTVIREVVVVVAGAITRTDIRVIRA